jgi:hypothetical protein
MEDIFFDVYETDVSESTDGWEVRYIGRFLGQSFTMVKWGGCQKPQIYLTLVDDRGRVRVEPSDHCIKSCGMKLE